MKVVTEAEKGWIRGSLSEDEDREQIVSILHHGKAQILDGKLDLKVHEHLKQNPHPPTLENDIQEKLGLLYQGELKRWVVQITTHQGPRIVKISESGNFKTTVAGLMGLSVAAREHKYQLRAESLKLGAAQTVGYLELWHGTTLVRSCQVQTLLDHQALILNDYLKFAMVQEGNQAMLNLGRALAHSHNLGFFHGDLKGFHALVEPNSEGHEYTLKWLDLARVGFRLSRRQRIINLYQMLRFVVPEHGEARDGFMRAYCEASGWYADNPNKAMTLVGKFLEHKLKTHPNP